MERRRIDPVLLLLLAAIGFYLYLNYRLVLYARFETDEFLHSSWGGDLHFGVPAYAPHMPGKTRLSLVLFSLPYKFTRRMADVLFINRHVVFVIVVLSLYLLFRLHGRVFESKRGALWAVLWTLACTTFIERGFRVRSDMVATFFALAGVYLFLCSRARLRALAAGAALSLAFCTTQKSAYFIAAFALAFWIAYRHAAEKPVRDFVHFAVGGVCAFAVYVLVFGWGGQYATVLRTTFVSDGVMKTALGKNYAGLSGYYWQTFSRNVAFYCLSFVGLACGLRRWGTNPWQQNFLAVFTLVLLGCMAIHREPWPYVFVMVIPFLGCFAGDVSNRVFEGLRKAPPICLAPALVLLAMVGIQTVSRHRAFLQITCLPQLKVVEAAEAILGPDDACFDGIRMIGTRKSSWPAILYKAAADELLDAWETEGPAFLETLRQTRCKVIIYNFRVAKLPESFHEFLESHYLLIDRNLFVSGGEITTSPQVLDVIWPGDYEAIVAGNCERIQIDGEEVDPAGGPVYLRAGEHRIAFQGSGRLLLIPQEAADWWRERPVNPSVGPLFGPP